MFELLDIVDSNTKEIYYYHIVIKVPENKHFTHIAVDDDGSIWLFNAEPEYNEFDGIWEYPEYYFDQFGTGVFRHYKLPYTVKYLGNPKESLRCYF